MTPEKTMLSRHLVLSNPVMFVLHGKAVALLLNTSLKFVSIHQHRHTGIYQQSEKQNEKLSYMICCGHCPFEPKCHQNCGHLASYPVYHFKEVVFLAAMYTMLM